MKSFQQGETVAILGHIYDYDDEFASQDGVNIVISQPDGVEVLTSTAMTFDAIGKYSYNYKLETDAELGVWTIKMMSLRSTEQTIENEMFLVKSSI